MWFLARIYRFQDIYLTFNNYFFFYQDQVYTNFNFYFIVKIKICFQFVLFFPRAYRLNSQFPA